MEINNSILNKKNRIENGIIFGVKNYKTLDSFVLKKTSDEVKEFSLKLKKMNDRIILLNEN